MEIIYLSFENYKHVACFCESICTMAKDFPFLFVFVRYSSNHIRHFVANVIPRCEFLANNLTSEMNQNTPKKILLGGKENHIFISLYQHTFNVP